MKTLHSFDVFSIETDLSLFKLVIFKDSKDIARNVFANILI